VRDDLLHLVVLEHPVDERAHGLGREPLAAVLLHQRVADLGHAVLRPSA